MKRYLFPILAVLGVSVASALIPDSNITQYGLGKTRGYLQTGAVTVTPNSFTFSAFVDATSTGVINKAQVSGPLSSYLDETKSGPQPLILYAGDADFKSTLYLLKDSLDTNFPNDNSGNYKLKIDSGEPGGTVSGGYDYDVSLKLGGDAYVTDVPTLTINNGFWSGGGSFIVDVNNPTLFSWDFSSYNSATDIVLFSIEPQSSGGDIVKMQFQGTNPGNFTVNAGLLTAGETYVGQLTFARIVDSPTDVPGVQGVAFYALETTFAFQAVPEPSTYALLVLGLGLVFLQVRRCRRP